MDIVPMRCAKIQAVGTSFFCDGGLVINRVIVQMLPHMSNVSQVDGLHYAQCDVCI